MLILTRREKDSVVFSHPDWDYRIEFTILGTKGKQNRIGIKAPNSVVIHRSEVQMRIDAENAALDVGDAA